MTEPDAASRPAASSQPPVPETLPAPPATGRLLGIDYGDKRMGFAVSNPEQTIACAIENYTRRTSALDLQQIRRWCQEYSIRGFVVGLPIHMNGNESQKSLQCRQFAAYLYQALGLPIALHDERCTTAVVLDQLIELDMSRKQRKKKVDMLAAQVLLQAYLDSKQPLRTGEPDSQGAV
jgi:putative Holliday junction resolvase